MKRTTHIVLLALVSTFASLTGGSPSTTAAEPLSGQVKIIRKAESITLPAFTLDTVTLWEAVRQLKAVGEKHSLDGIGVNFLVTGTGGVKTGPTITLTLQKVTLLEATERLAVAANVRVSAQDYAVVFDTSQDRAANKSVETNRRPAAPLDAGR